MKITLKRILLCGICLLGSLLFFLMLVIKIKASYGPELAFSAEGSFFDAFSGQPFEKVFQYIHSTRPWVEKHTTDADKIAKEVATSNNTFRIFGIVGLIAILLSVVANVGAFLLPNQKAARKLLIPFKSIEIVVMFLVFVIAAGSLSADTKSYHVTYSEANFTGLTVLFLIGLACFVGALISAGVVKDKVLVGKKD